MSDNALIKAVESGELTFADAVAIIAASDDAAGVPWVELPKENDEIPS